MAVTAFASGTQTATIGTEHTLSSVNVQGRYELVVDLSALAAGDVVELRGYSEVLGAGTAKVALFYQFFGVQPTDQQVMITDIIDNDLADAVSLKWTLKQTFGTGRAFPWKVLSLQVEPANFTLLDINASGQVNVGKWLSSAVSALTVGIPDVNVKNFNNVAAQTDANSLPKVDAEDWKGAAVAGAVPPDTIFIRNGTAQGGSTTSITLDAGASAVNDFYKNEVVFIRSGTGAGQAAIITAYNGTTKVATVGGFATAPDATSVFSVMAFGPSLAAGGLVTANVTQWNGSAVATPAVAGVPVVDLKYILGALLSEGAAGRLAAGFKELLDVATPVFNLASINQTGDAFARLGAPAGASVSADIAAIFARLGAPVLASIDADIQNVKNQVWDEVLTAATHNIATSAGRRLRTLSQVVLFDGLVQSATAFSITFQAGPSTTNDVYIGSTVVLTSGGGSGEARVIVDWNGATLTAVINTPLTAIPVLGDSVQIQASDNQAVVASGAVTGVPTSTTVPLEASASAVNNIYVGMTLLLQNAAGPDSEARVITAYNGTTKTATVSPALNRTPAAGDAYSVWNSGRAMVDVANVDSAGVTTLLSRLTQAILFDASGFVKSDVEDWRAVLANALIAGRVDADDSAALTAQGYTTVRAGYLDTLNGLVAAIWNALTSGMVTAGSIGLLIKTNLDATVSSVNTAVAAVNTLATAISGKLGAFTGITTSNVFNWLQAMMRSDVATPPDIGGTYTSLADALQAIAAGGGGGGSTATQIWNFLTTGIVTTGSIGKFILGLTSGGGGSLLCTFTVTVAGLPKDGVDTWITTDAAGLNIIARATTNDVGQVQFLLDPGSYYWWKQLAGFTWTPNPEPITVS